MLAELGRIFRFALVGLSSTAIYFALLWCLRDFIASVIALTALCYLISMVYNFVLQSAFTFRAGAPTRHSLLRFALMHFAAMGINSALMAGLVTGLRVPMFAAQILVTALISVTVFVLSKHWVYGPANPLQGVADDRNSLTSIGRSSVDQTKSPARRWKDRQFQPLASSKDRVPVRWGDR
jgi:putative flippase GtrA